MITLSLLLACVVVTGDYRSLIACQVSVIGESQSSMVDWDSVLSGVKDKPIEIVIEEPKPKKKLIRLPGRIHYGPHPGCGMCLRNHLVGSHGMNRSELNRIGYSQWLTLHSNIHNRNSTKPTMEPSNLGRQAQYPMERGSLFRRWRRR